MHTESEFQFCACKRKGQDKAECWSPNSKSYSIRELINSPPSHDRLANSWQVLAQVVTLSNFQKGGNAEYEQITLPHTYMHRGLTSHCKVRHIDTGDG